MTWRVAGWLLEALTIAVLSVLVCWAAVAASLCDLQDWIRRRAR